MPTSITVYSLRNWYYTVMSIIDITLLAIIFSTTFLAMAEYYNMVSNLDWIFIDIEQYRSDPIIVGINWQIL